MRNNIISTVRIMLNSRDCKAEPLGGLKIDHQRDRLVAALQSFLVPAAQRPTYAVPAVQLQERRHAV
jgi:hypothetical protein